MPSFEHYIIDTLTKYDGTVSEFKLLQLIESELPEFFNSLPDPSRLYQKHFWLFHNLYKLKSTLAKRNLQLTVSALSIELRPSSTGTQPEPFDPLVEFYLDEKNLHLSEQEVAAMQKEFWKKYIALDNKAAAIKTLQLVGVKPLTLSIVKKQYQKLAQRHHPDKGGEEKKFGEIQKAYQELKLILT